MNIANSISANHNVLELNAPRERHMKNVEFEQNLAQAKINEIKTQPKKTEYVNFQGQKIGSVINDAA